jgi:ribosomal protein S18 acetylase RimI-like enzyme
MPQVFKKLGQLGPDPQVQKRAEHVLCCIPDNVPDAWIIDSVATLPAYRRKGIVDRLLTAILEKGRQKGFRRAQINLYIGNQPAQHAYEKHGFKITDQKCHPNFEAEIGSPGMACMLRNL